MDRAKRWISVLLILLLCLSLLPAAFADGEPEAAPVDSDGTSDTAGEQFDENGLAEEDVSPGEHPETETEPELPPEETGPADEETAPSDEETAPAAGDMSAPEEEPDEVETLTLTFSDEQQIIVPGGDDNDELFAGYVAEMFGIAPQDDPWAPALDGAKKNVGQTLTGADRVMYELLCERITAVASGRIPSTEFYISFETLVGGKTSWTAAELGVSSIVSNGSISQEAVDAFLSRVMIDPNTIIRALLADHPYEMYWYDKVSGTPTSWSQGFSALYNGEEYVLYPSGGYTMCFSVAEAYAEGEYLVMANVGQAVSASVERAQSIVRQYADVSDYQKLVGYRDEICTLASYNDDAAGDNTTPYGDPWQLIWVFDGDPDTNIVCEGYSKAFQYLCDMTSFNGSITCYSVSGVMMVTHVNGATEGGGHMWNIVTMDDGKNYLVDITNCDASSIGYPDLLFLRGYTSFSAESGYTYDCHGSNVSYTYDNNMSTLFTASDLTLSAEDYVHTVDHFASSTMSADDGRVMLIGAGILGADDCAGVADKIVMLDRRTTDVTEAAAENLQAAQAVLIVPTDAEKSCFALLETLSGDGIDNARMLSDADGDGMTTAADVSRLLRTPADEIIVLALDVNFDGETDETDAQLIADYIVGNIARFPVE